MAIPTPHISAGAGDFAKTVLMPGDPLRSAYIAEHFLTDAKLVNNVRGVQGYTGYYQGNRGSVMASGMGQPAIGIYSYELFHYSGVSSIIRVGSCGSLSEEARVRDLIVAMGACTDGNYASQYRLPGTFCPIADYTLLSRAVAVAGSMGVRAHVGNVLSSDVFYDDAASTLEWAKMGVLGVEMEAAALYCNAARAGRRALCLCTVSDSFLHPEHNLSAQERQTSFEEMIRVALETAEA